MRSVLISSDRRSSMRKTQWAVSGVLLAALGACGGGSEDQAIAGLLHDVIEDCGAHHGPRIRAEFGDNVARIVVACTDGTAEEKAEHADAEAKRLKASGHALPVDATATVPAPAQASTAVSVAATAAAFNGSSRELNSRRW